MEDETGQKEQESVDTAEGSDDAEAKDDAQAIDQASAPSDSLWYRRARTAALVLAVTLVLWLLFTWITWPDVAALREDDPRTTAFIEMYGEARRDAGESDAVAWQFVPYDRISVNLKRAVVASEDTEFFFHDGFSTHEVKEALKKAIREGEAPRGASTITQQVAKNLWLTPRRSLTRKLREAILTRQLEKHLSKQRILDLHLNIAEFGPGIYGAEAASRHYFGIPASDLSPRQGAMLAAGLPRPKRWNPASDGQHYRASVERILNVQKQLQYLDSYIGSSEPGAIGVRPPQVPAPAP
ncbi:MAG: monofunctional biosynthetic peptidoglycan transglycosylase [Gemmatimonadetes bacterium]|nr:monofunctional biosynthetic peptidoglycan transglycosylase [Gemmatimonadota bacterium]